MASNANVLIYKIVLTVYDVVGITGNDPFNFSMNEKIINKTKALDKEYIKKITTVRNKSFVI